MKFLRFLYHMVPALISLLKDLLFKHHSREENRLHYLFGKANAYDQAGLSDLSIRVYEKILKKLPDSIPVLMNLGGIYFRNRKYEKAVPYYEKVIRINPRHYQGHYWLAVCYLHLQRYYAAIHTLEDVIESLPTFKDALNLLGECYERVGEAAKAEHYYLKAISIDSEGKVLQAGLLNRLTHEKNREERVRH